MNKTGTSLLCSAPVSLTAAKACFEAHMRCTPTSLSCTELLSPPHCLFPLLLLCKLQNILVLYANMLQGQPATKSTTSLQ